MAQFLEGVESFRGELDLAVRGYFEVIFSDEIDPFIYLFGFSRRFLKKIRIEGEENLKEALRNKGGILLSAHFGGGFWILPLLREKGIPVHFFSAGVAKKNYPFEKSLYYYHRLRIGIVERASGRRTLYKRRGRQDLTLALNEKKWVSILLDVPPFLVKDVIEVPFLSQKAMFPKGIISIAKETHVPILPFFSFLDEGRRRRICFEEPIHVVDEEECVKKCVALIEKRIIERPDHWHFWPNADEFFVKDN